MKTHLLSFTLAIILCCSSTPEAWVSSRPSSSYQPPSKTNHGWSSQSKWSSANRRPSTSSMVVCTPVQQQPVQQQPTGTSVPNQNLVYPVQSVWPKPSGSVPSRPQQPQPSPQRPSLPNQQFVKPVISAWPKPSYPAQSSSSTNNGHNNQALVKPVFEAWPQGQNQKRKESRPLVDVPFTVEIVSSSGSKGYHGSRQRPSYGWRR